MHRVRQVVKPLSSALRLGVCRYRSNTFRPKICAACYCVDGNSRTQVLQAVRNELEDAEQKIENIPIIDDFTSSVTSSGCVAELSKYIGDEKVLVRFDVRESVDVSDNELFEEIEEDEDVSEDNFESEPVFAPSFTVDITQSSGQTLRFECCVDPYAIPMTHSQLPKLELNSMSFITADGSNPTDPAYTVDCNTLDLDLHSALLNYLEEKGITNSFVEKLLSFNAVLENREYAKFLKNLETFVSH
ncbi:uncharacterized protein LOC134183826 [Corticium candelabrum]|uniref:uncharacterized protein LOC134183826 n=1 Tax=Corticium candelabrum TaxID=121492 RepID=UPI002E25BD5E|nr:uncharacterized protein LOC134183826 [Corticium candelabrum]